MVLIASKLYKAFKKSGVDEKLAEEASAEYVDFNKKIKQATEELDKRIYNLQKDNDSNFALLRKDIESLHKVMNCKFNVLTTLFGGMIICFVGAIIAFFLK